MNNYPKSIQALIDSFTLLPGVGKKTAERYAFALINDFSITEAEEFSENIVKAIHSIHECPICGALTDGEKCEICLDETRDQTTIMVVETTKDVYLFEALNGYNGLYHVLGGALELSKGIDASDLFIEPLLERVKKGTIKEVILASNFNVAGQLTARYLKELLSDFPDVKVSRLAHGLPSGSDISYADQMTLIRALEGRNKFE